MVLQTSRPKIAPTRCAAGIFAMSTPARTSTPTPAALSVATAARSMSAGELLAAARAVVAAALLLAAGATPSKAHNFVTVTDPGNPIVTATVSGAYTGAAWVDMDGDNLLDLFISRKATVYRNLGGGSFVAVNAAVPNQGNALGTTWSDADNDGDLDVFLSGSVFVGNGSNYYRNDGNFVFTKITTGDIGNAVFNSGWGCTFGDIDNDAYTDIVVAAANGFGGVNHVNRLLYNNGDGSFSNVDTTVVTDTLDAHTVATFSDYDDDGDQDLFIGSGQVTQLSEDNLFRNMTTEQGDWGFTRIATAPIATDLVDGQVWNWIDYDNDGDLDGYLTNYTATLPNKLYRNDSGTYVTMTAGDVGPIVTEDGGALANVWGDFDNDGDLDCYVTNDGQSPADYFFNNGDGTFSQDLTSVLATDLGPFYGASAGDYDRDGDLDMYVQGTTVTKRLYRNDLANGNAYLVARLVGAGAPGGSNVSALGAKVRAKAVIGGSPVWQRREVSAQNSFNSMNMLDVHFGLGSAVLVDSLVVEWPSGITEVFTSIPVNREMEIHEGIGATDVPVAAGTTSGLLLEPNAPNPFSDSTTIAFALPQAAHSTLTIHDVAGRLVRTLVDEVRAEGRHSVEWDARDEAGKSVSSGVYFTRLRATGNGAPFAATVTRRVTLQRDR